MSIRRVRSRQACLVVLVIALLVLGTPLGAATSDAGSAGTDTSLPATNSAVTLSGRPCAAAPDGCGFQNLRISVSQTKNLLHQAISVTWSGGAVTQRQQTQITGNFLQLFECWGDVDPSMPANPGPLPQNCEFGGYQSNPRALSQTRLGGQFVASRVLSAAPWSGYDTAGGYLDSAQGVRWMPYQAVDGTVTNRAANFSATDPYLQGQGAYWLNSSFNAYTTNEIPVAVTSPNGTGAELFTVDTGLEAPGLGCGQKIQPSPAGPQVPKCWLVIVPRGNSVQENPAGQQASATPVVTSPLTTQSWQNRIAVPLEFNPVDSSCPIGADERRIVGSELATSAVTSWQPKLCAAPGAPPYNYSSISDDLARQQLVAGGIGGAGMAVVSRPIGQDVAPAGLAYAPLTLSGVTLGFNIERTPASNTDGSLVDPAEGPLSGLRVAQINLTPRLVAKLLSESYQQQFGGYVPPYPWYKTNALNLLVDPDFLQFNPEFKLLVAGTGGAGRIIVSQPTADAAYTVWRWVLTDPEAAQWLAGAPDQWGMKVNPVYATDASKNPGGVAFGQPLPDAYPKSDPFCFQSAEVLIQANNAHPRPLCMLDIAPYANSMDSAAEETRLASDGAKTVLDTDALSSDTAWVTAGPQPAGVRTAISVTDTASAARYGLQTASISRAGDDQPGRAFVAPTTTSLTAGDAGMAASSVDGVAASNPSPTNSGAYPLTMLTYGVVAPDKIDSTARRDYAAFIDYAAGPGQTPGLDLGMLPPGYAPLPAARRHQASAAAALIRAGGEPAPATSGAGGPSASGTGRGGGVPAGLSTAGIGHGDGQASGTAGSGTPSAALAPAGTTAAGSSAGAPAVAPATTRTPMQRVGWSKYTIPGAFAIALLAFLGVLALDDRWLRAVVASRAAAVAEKPGEADS